MLELYNSAEIYSGNVFSHEFRTTRKEEKTMTEVKSTGFMGVLWALLSGLISFTVGALVAAYLYTITDNFFIIAVGSGIGGLLLGLMLAMREKLPRLVLICIAAVPVGILATFLLAGILELFMPGGGPIILMDILSITFTGLVFGFISGFALYGIRSSALFALVTAIVATPFGYLVALFNSGAPIKEIALDLVSGLGITDVNLLAILMGLGSGLGLSIGLYRWGKRHPRHN